MMENINNIKLDHAVAVFTEHGAARILPGEVSVEVRPGDGPGDESVHIVTGLAYVSMRLSPGQYQQLASAPAGGIVDLRPGMDAADGEGETE